MIEESYVSSDTAKLLKEAGFDIPINMNYTEKGGVKYNLMPDNFNKFDDKFSRPTQALVARWLREVHGIHVIITEDAYADGVNYLWQVLVYDSKFPNCWSDKSTGLYGDNGEYKTYEDALETGLRYGLELIKTIGL